jgi:hypothetical protein
MVQFIQQGIVPSLGRGLLWLYVQRRYGSHREHFEGVSACGVNLYTEYQIKMKGILGIFLALVLLSAVPSIAQTSKPSPTVAAKAATAQPKDVVPKSVAPKADDSMTNDHVIKLVKSGLSDSIIVAAIERAEHKRFDTSADGLVNLKSQGVSDQVIAAVLGIKYEPPAKPAPEMVDAKPAPAVESKAAPPQEANASTGTVKAAEPSSSKFGFFGKIIPKVKVQKSDSTDLAEAKANNGSKPWEPSAVNTIAVGNGEPAFIRTTLPKNQAMSKTKSYLDSKQFFDLAVESDRISSGWAWDRRCGPGIQHCEDRVVADFSLEGSQTVVRLRVIERKREGGLSEKPWHENSESRGKETSLMASELQRRLTEK